MRRLTSWGSQKAKADAMQSAADQEYSRPWPAAEGHPAQIPNTQQHPSNAGQASGSQLSDDELRVMEQSALEYAIMQSQQQTERCSPFQACVVTVSHAAVMPDSTCTTASHYKFVTPCCRAQDVTDSCCFTYLLSCISG